MVAVRHGVIYGGRNRVDLRDVVNHGVTVIGLPCVEFNVYVCVYLFVCVSVCMCVFLYVYICLFSMYVLCECFGCILV